MKLKNCLNQVCTLLTSIQCPYGVIGGLATQAYGIKRDTNDVDIIIAPKSTDEIKNGMASIGYDLDFANDAVLRYIAEFRVDLLIALDPWLIDSTLKALPSTASNLVVLPEDLIAIKFRAMLADPDRYQSDLMDVYLILDHFENADMNKIGKFAEKFQIHEFIGVDGQR